ncbi:MAG: nuclear export mediator factor NEMF [Amphiamblys sp. WSBS2006]|nr:MAG: nuclear export mediator factor NEMF [Amphiamblys sp. WSBS2006]
MKQSFTSTDIFCCVSELEKVLVGASVVNVYNFEGKTVFIKLNTKGKTTETLVIEPGRRIHLCDFEAPKNSFPSPQAVAMRKFIRRRRLASIRQVGVDRVVELVFGEGAVTVCAELYGQGNVVFLDESKKVVLSQRKTEGEYLLRENRLLTLAELKEQTEALGASPAEKIVRKALFPGIFPELIEDILLRVGLTKTSRLGELSSASCFSAEVERAGREGYSDGFASPVVVFSEGVPVSFRTRRLLQDAGLEQRSFATFKDAVRFYFETVEGKKTLALSKTTTAKIERKIENVRQMQQGKIDELRAKIEKAQQMAASLEEHLPLAEECVRVGRFVFDAGLSPGYTERVTREARGDSRAEAIVGFDRKGRSVELEFEATRVRLDVDSTVQGNRNRLYESKKKLERKLEKTVQANRMAIESAGRKIRRQEKTKTAPATRKKRKRRWFEKFNWFVSSSQELVISGKDAGQNEMAVKKHLGRGDIYAHCEMSGSASVVVKKHPSAEKVSLRSTLEAGIMSTVYGRAWDAKIPTGAWWVYPAQVSRTAPTGEYISTGSFVIRGKKNFLPPAKMEYGLGILFQTDRREARREEEDESIRRGKYSSLLDGWAKEEDTGEALPDDLDGEVFGQVEMMTGCPREDDTLHYALPMCAPYNVVRDFAYSVKLVPGPLKKGQAVKELRHVFSETIKKKKAQGGLDEDVLELHRRLVGEIPEEEFSDVLLSNVRVCSDFETAQKKPQGRKKKR